MKENNRAIMEFNVQDIMSGNSDTFKEAEAVRNQLMAACLTDDWSLLNTEMLMLIGQKLN